MEKMAPLNSLGILKAPACKNLPPQIWTNNGVILILFKGRQSDHGVDFPFGCPEAVRLPQFGTISAMLFRHTFGSFLGGLLLQNTQRHSYIKLFGQKEAVGSTKWSHACFKRPSKRCSAKIWFFTFQTLSCAARRGQGGTSCPCSEPSHMRQLKAGKCAAIKSSRMIDQLHISDLKNWN